MKVGVDLDGVVADFVGGTRKWCLEKFGKDVGEATSWDWMKKTLTEAEMRKFWVGVSGEEEFWGALEPLKDGMGLVEELNERGWEITYISSRGGDNMRGISIDWLVGRGIMCPQVIIVPPGPRAAKGKADLLDVIGIDMFVDDNVPNVLEAEKISTVTWITLAARPWNAEFDDAKHRVRREDLVDLTWRMESSRVNGN